MNRRFALFDYGFRPFFLLAAAYAVAAMVIWMLTLSGEVSVASGRWHGHEMLYGVVVAAVAGFLLTAVPSWTGSSGFSGLPLLCLVILWLAGRVVMLPWVVPPSAAAALVDVAFVPALAVAVAPRLLRARNFRNLPVLAILVLLAIGNLLFHFPHVTELGSGDGALIGVDTMLILVTLIGGRITPSFTASTLARAGRTVSMPAFGALDRAAMIAVLLVWMVDVVAPGGAAAGAIALLGGVLHAARGGRWQAWAARGDPLTWVLHLGYAWVAVGLGLKGIWLLWGLDLGANWLHALTVGAFATMMLGVMSRATLGHTGRALVAPAAVVGGYAAITLCALLRVFGHLLAPGWPHALAGAFWIGAFALFLLACAPMLWAPRIDGRPG